MQALAPLLLVALTAGGAVEVPLAVRLDVQHRPLATAPTAPAPSARQPSGWVISDGDARRGAAGRSGGATWDAAVELAAVPGEAGLRVTVTITYRADVRVEREVLELGLPATAVQVAGRDGRVADAPPVVHVDHWSPRLGLVTARGAPLLVDAGELEGLEVRRAPGRVTLGLELDVAANHPFVVETRCRRHWRRREAGVDESARLRLKGERVVYHARILLGATPLLVDRLPRGRRAALVFSDHADQTRPATFRLLLHGAGRRRAGVPGGGFLGHGLTLTKALFWRGRPGAPQLESRRVRALARELLAAGGEVALHSPTRKADRRRRTRAALAAVRDLGVTTWVDHQPPTNCEAFTNQGWGAGDFGVVDLLAAERWRYVWAAGAEPRDDANLLRPGEPAARTPLLYPWAAPTVAGRGTGLYLFRSVWAYLEADDFFALLAPARLDRLEAERGVAILHTYLEARRRERALRGRNLVRRDRRHGRLEMDPRLDLLLADLARRSRAGRLWVTTVRDLGDYLRGVGGLERRYGPAGEVWLRNPGPAPVRGVTLRLPRAGARLEAGGAGEARATPEGPTLVLDLGPGAVARVTARDAAGRPLPLGGTGSFRFRAAPARP